MKNRLYKAIPECGRDLSEGVDVFKHLDKTVTMFGSASIQPDHVLYRETVYIFDKLAEKGYDVITGSGPGLMEAANKGAQLGKGKSAGIGLVLPDEPSCNKFVDEGMSHVASYFFTRKVLMVDHADAFVIMPGGIGTMDELFELVTLMYTEQITKRPVVVANLNGFYNPLKAMLQGFIDNGTLKERIWEFVTFVDTAREVIDTL